MSRDEAAASVKGRARGSRAEGLLQRFGVRLFLSAAILASLLPYGRQPVVEIVFLVVFGVEFALRCYVFVTSLSRPRDPNESPRLALRRRLGQLAFLVIDLLALMSFVPWDLRPEHARWLRVFRLSRMLLLIGYWSPLVRDFWTVLTRRERARQLALLALIVLFLAFGGAAVLDHMAADIDFNGDGLVNAADENFATRFWWSFRQMEDPGNLIAQPGEVAALVISVGLTIAGLFLVSFLIGLGSDIVSELVDLDRTRPVGLDKHTVIVHLSPGVPQLLRELTSYYEKLFRPSRYAVVGADDEPPDMLRAPDLPRVRYRSAAAHGADFVTRADVAAAHRVIILAPDDAPWADARTASAILNVREANRDAWIVAEILEQASASAARVAGGPRTTVVPTEKFLALYAATTIRAPARLELIDELLSPSSGHEVYTFFYDLSGRFEGGHGDALAARPGWTLDALHHLGISGAAGARVVPLGVALEDAPDTPGPPSNVLLGTSAAALPDAPIRAVIAAAASFSGARAFGEHLRDRTQLAPPPAPTRPAPAWAPPQLRPSPARIVMCGFRPATVDLAATLMAAYPAVRVQLLVSDADAEAAALKAFREHSVHIEAQLWHEHGPWGTFEAHRDESLTYCAEGKPPGTGRLTLHIADWTSERTLLALPDGRDHLGQADILVLLGGTGGAADWPTAMTVLKVADLIRAQRDRFPDHFQVVCGVHDSDLGERLREGFGRAVGTHGAGLRVLATESLRTLFTFHSVTVPGIDAIYSELLSAWGQAPTRLVPAESAKDGAELPWTFEGLAAALRPEGRQLLCVEIVARDGAIARCWAPAPGEPGARFALRRLHAAWVLEAETT